MNDTIFITGGAKRIGKAIVAHFHKIGWNVIFQYRTSSESAKLISEELNGIRKIYLLTYLVSIFYLLIIDFLMDNTFSILDLTKMRLNFLFLIRKIIFKTP